MTTVTLIVALWATRAINPLRGDTFEYFYFDRSRTIGYPAFLWVIRLVTGEVALAVQAQMLVLAVSLFLLGWSFHVFAGRPKFTFAFQATLLSNGAMWKSCAFLMTEALSTALIALWCAQILRMIKAPSFWGAVLLVAASGIGTMVRPSLVGLFFGTAVFALVALPSRERGWASMLAVAGLVSSWGATPLAQLLVHGSAETTSPFGRGVLQHTLYCDSPGIPEDADSIFVEQNASQVRQYIATAPASIQQGLRRAYSTPLRFGLIIPVLGRRHQLGSRSQVDTYLSRIANERVASNPLCYAQSVAGAYYRMATFATTRTKQDEREIRTFTATHPPVELPQYAVLPRDEQLARRAASEARGEVSGLNPERMRLDIEGKISALPVVPVRLLYSGSALISLLWFAALAIRRRLTPKRLNVLAGAAAMGVAFHVTVAITALVELGLSRYVLPLWPVVCSLVAIAILSRLKRRAVSSQLKQPVANPAGIPATSRLASITEPDAREEIISAFPTISRLLKARQHHPRRSTEDL